MWERTSFQSWEEILARAGAPLDPLLKPKAGERCGGQRMHHLGCSGHDMEEFPISISEIKEGGQPKLCFGVLQGGLWPVQDTDSESHLGNHP